MISVLALLAAVVSGDLPAGIGRAQAGLVATATVIRPAEISTVSTDSERDVVTVTKSVETRMAAEGGTITRLDGDRWSVSQAGAEPVVVSLTY